MINPNDVELLIFDLDGTIFQADKPALEAMKKAIHQTGLNIRVSEEDVRKLLGESSEKYYENILPPKLSSYWPEIRKVARKHNDAAIRDFGQAFPGVKETLCILKNRGYKLALYTNASVQYLSQVVSVLDIGDYFEYIECTPENELSKLELVRKIQGKFQNMKAAVVGDRIHDIEAAQNTNSLSIGVLYGYGGNELEKAHITIKGFPELLDIFDRRLPIFEKILQEINIRKPDDRAFVIGITGIDVSGKTKFAESLEKFLISRRYKTQVVNLDDFHNPQQIRYSGENQAENYYNRSFNIESIVNNLLIPLRQKDGFCVKLTLLDLHSDRYEVEREFYFSRNTIVVFEGVFLFRNELSSYIDYKVFLEIPFEESKGRAKLRDLPIYGQGILERYDEKYLPAQKKYLNEFPPLETADMIINNCSWEYPIVK